MLPPTSDFKDKLKQLAKEKEKRPAIEALVKEIGAYMNKIQAGPLGKEGILTFNEPIMVTMLSLQSPVPDSSWVDTFATAWQLALMASIITPGTVTNPAWVSTGSKDLLTLPTAAASIPTISVAKQLLSAQLMLVKAEDSAPEALASAIATASKALMFLCIGLGPPPAVVPIPMPLPAQ